MFWREVCQNYLSANPGRVITRFQFSKLFSEAWHKGMTMLNVVAGFKVTGIYPLNRDALKPKKCKSSLLKDTGLKYIPMLTPRPCRNDPSTPQFTDSEFAHYQSLYEEGKECVEDGRYGVWKRMYRSPAECLCNDRKVSFSEDSSDPCDPSCLVPTTESSTGMIACDHC